MSTDKNKLIPELRFPEFLEEGEWEEKPIGEIFNSFSGGTPSTSERKYYNGDIPFIRSAEINKECTELFLTDEGLRNSSAKIVNKGDLLVALYGANSGDSAICKINGGINQAILCLQSGYSNIYTYNFLTFKKDWIVSRFIQGGQGNLSADIVKSIIIPFPKKEEQQKIASCLSSLDEVIAAHSQKLATLKDHKKGLMQNLFPTNSITNDELEITNVPNYRFPEFLEDEGWVEKKLGEVCQINPKVSQLPERFVYIDLESVENGTLLQKKFINSVGAPSRAQRLLKDNDVIFQMVRPYQKNNYYFFKSDDLDYVASTGYAQLRAFKSSMYLYQFIHSDNFVNNVLEKCTGSNYPAINSSDLSQISVQLPKPEEQQKIASCLSSLDDLITAQTEKIAQLKLHKKGLMQGLFPGSITN
jgi:type I restriction enzyme S subunit